MCDAHLVRGHSERVDVTPSSRVAVLQIETGGVQQFWGHVSNGSNRGRHRATGVDSVRIRDDRDEPVVCEASMGAAVDDDVCLCGIISEGQPEPLVARTGLRSLWMMSIECRYCNPLAASASLRGISGFVGGEKRILCVRDGGD